MRAVVSVDQTTFDCAPDIRKNSADSGNLSWSVSYNKHNLLNGNYSIKQLCHYWTIGGVLFSDDVASQMILMGVRAIIFSTRRHASEDCVKDEDMHEWNPLNDDKGVLSRQRRLDAPLVMIKAWSSSVPVDMPQKIVSRMKMCMSETHSVMIKAWMNSTCCFLSCDLFLQQHYKYVSASWRGSGSKGWKLP